MDVSQMTDEALVDSVLFWRHGHRSRGFLESQIEREVATRKAELLRRLRLAANARPEQVTLAMAQQNVMDTMVRVHGSIQDETYRNLLDAMYEHVPKALAQLPWPQGSGALHPLPKEGWREVDDALAASTQDAPTEVDSDE